MHYEHSSYFLAHHGIQGQKWGVRNGPPYPLSEGQKRRYGGRNVNKGGFREDSIEYQIANRKVDDSKTHVSNQLSRLSLRLALFSPFAAVNAYALMSHVNANNKEKRANKRLAKLEIEKRTGLHIKSEKDKNMTREQDAKAVNPAFHNLSSLTKMNCVLCSSTYELRRRGYDVIAEKDKMGYAAGDVKVWFPKAKYKIIKEYAAKDISNMKSTDSGKKQVKISDKIRAERAKDTENLEKAKKGKNKEFAETVINTLLKEPEGSRGNLFVGFGSGAGHSVSYEIQNGKVIIIDSQCGKVKRGAAVDKLLSSCVTASYFRLDNVAFDPKKIKEVCH